MCTKKGRATRLSGEPWTGLPWSWKPRTDANALKTRQNQRFTGAKPEFTQNETRLRTESLTTLTSWSARLQNILKRELQMPRTDSHGITERGVFSVYWKLPVLAIWLMTDHERSQEPPCAPALVMVLMLWFSANQAKWPEQTYRHKNQDTQKRKHLHCK